MLVTHNLPYQYNVSSRTRYPLTAAVFHSYRRIPDSLLRQQNSLHTTKIKYFSQQPHYYVLHYWKDTMLQMNFSQEYSRSTIKWIWPWSYSSHTSSDTTVPKRCPCRVSVNQRVNAWKMATATKQLWRSPESGSVIRPTVHIKHRTTGIGESVRTKSEQQTLRDLGFSQRWWRKLKSSEMSAVSLDKYLPPFWKITMPSSAGTGSLWRWRRYEPLLCFVRQIQREVKVLHLEDKSTKNPRNGTALICKRTWILKNTLWELSGLWITAMQNMGCLPTYRALICWRPGIFIRRGCFSRKYISMYFMHLDSTGNNRRCLFMV